MRQDLNTDGQGFGMDAVVATIPLPVNMQVQWQPHDLDVGDYVLDNRPQPLVVVGAEERRAQTCSLVVGSPLSAEVESSTRLRTTEGQDLCPVLVALGRVAGRDVAVLGVAYGPLSYEASGYGLAVVDMADPKSPQLLGITRLDLPDLADLVLDGETALVSSANAGTEVVNLGDPDRPYSAGHIDNLSGRLGVGDGGTYLSSGGVYQDSPAGGLHVAGGQQCNLLDLREEKLLLEVVRDPVDGTLCGGGDVLVFNVCEASQVTLRIDGRLEWLSLDGLPAARIAEMALAPGWHTVQVPFGTIGSGLDTVKPFVLSARSQADPTITAERQGTIQNKILNRPVLPIGRTFVKGVDLFDGHVVRQASDVKIQGRHLGLEVTRTYSSAARGEDGRVGAGWGWNYDAAVSPMSCGLYNVSTADGGGQVFRSSDGGQTFTPQKGHHGKLKRLPDTGYEYVDKAGVKHYFREPVDPAQPEGARRLERVVEPHGDRIEVAYDLQGRVSSVREVLRGERPVRSLDVRYTRVYGHDRLGSVESSLGHRVEYGYDDKGNLTSVKRSGLNVDGGPDAEPTTEAYEYSTASTRDPHQMTAAVGPNGDRTEYAYHEAGDSLPGEAIALSWIVSHKEELAKQVKELANEGPVPTPETKFAYDFSQGPSSIYTTTVKDARGYDSVYTLNIHGSPTRIEEPLGKETLIGWKPNDILKADERDALGRITRYDYDARGNLTLERIEKDGAPLAETVYEYDPQYNKLSYKKDAEGRETKHTIDPATGDLLATLDAVGNRTEFHYDGDGQLEWTKDPRGFTTIFRAFNDFGSPREILNPLNQLTTRSYDSRNRLVEERQEPYGRLARLVYDGHDRPIEQLRVSGGPASGDERTLTEYYPGGQPKASTNPLGARTEYTLDGLNRVVRTAVVVGNETLTTETQYDGNGNAIWEKDRRGVARKRVYDELNRLSRVEVESTPNGEGPLGQVAGYGYDLVGNKTSETDVNGFVTEFRYDGLYHLEKKIVPVTNPATSTNYEELYKHDKVGNLRRTTDANGKVTETEYDNLNRPTKVTRDVGGLNLVTTTKYDDPEGSHVNKSEERDVAKGLRTSFLYDELNREKERKVHLEGEDGDPAPNPGPYTTTTAYEDPEHAVLTTDPRGVKTLRKLDGLDRVVEETVDTEGLTPVPPLSLTTTVRYDGLGNKKELTDPENRKTTFDYDELGRLRKTTDAKDQETRYTYFGDGLKASETDRRGVERLFDYDSLGRLRKTRLGNTPFSGVAWSQETQYVDALEPKRIEIDARGKRTIFDLDGLGRVKQETDHLGNYRTFTWDGVNKIEETDKRHFKTSFEYDGVNRLKKTVDPLLQGEPARHTVETTYEDALNRVTTKDRRGYLTRTQTDPLGRVVSVTRAVGTPDEAVLETNGYDGNGNKTLAADAEGKKTRFEYDAANRLIAREDGFETTDAAVTSFRYDNVGNLLEERDARAAALSAPWSVKRTYDDLNLLETETDGEENLTRYGYDPEGNRRSVQTPKGPTTLFDYDELGKLTKVTQPSPAVGMPQPVTDYGYDENRNRLRQTDANTHVVTMEYDDLNRLKKTTQDPGGLNLVTETTRFDENGNPEEIVDPNGQTIKNTYDELNRLKAKSYAFAPADTKRPWRYTASVDYGYDANGNLETIDEHVASGTSPPDTTLTTTRTYDGLDRLKSETQPLPDGGSRKLTYTYFKNGARQTVTDPANSVTEYTYDGQNRLLTATTGAGGADPRTTSYSYEPDDLLKAVSYPNGVVATHGYDKADRLVSLVNAKGGATISSYLYSGTHPTTGLPVSYDRNGNRLIQIETNAGQTETTTYGYDDLDRLTSVSYPVDAAYPNGRVVGYGYDAVGNRIRETEKNQADAVLADKQGIFDNANRLTELTDLVAPANTTTFTWDANGNQLTKTTAGVTTENRYDLRDKLVEVVQGASTLGRFQYDAEGRRNLKIGEGLPGDTLRQYVYDQTSLLTEYDAGGVQKAKYDYGSDRLISLTRTDEGRRYFSLDGLRSVVNLTDDNGSAVASYHLDAWGNFRFPTELDASRNRFAFTGHIFDTETGLYNAKARYFDPKLGRFLTQDSYLGQIDDPPSLHRYLYGNANPTFYTDPTGYYSWSEFKSDANWAGDFAGAFVSDLKKNAGRRAVKIGEAVVSNAAHMVVEAGAQTHDVLVLAADAGKRTVTGEGFDNIELWSDTAKSAGEAFAQGKSTSEVILGSAKQVAVSTLSAGIIPTVQQQYSALADFSAGKASIEDVENRLADAAGGAILNAGLASYASAKLGYGWRGQPLSAEFAQLAQRGSSILSGAKGMLEGGAERLHEAIGKNDFTTLGRIEPPVTPSGGIGIVNRGGRFSQLDSLKAAGEVGHHMPQNASLPSMGLSRSQGPALGMTQADHALTRTFRGRGARAMRQDAGLTARQRLAKDVWDIKRRFGTKYNKGLLEMLDYANTLRPFEKPPTP
jgi:RHS repeat-associated protein